MHYQEFFDSKKKYSSIIIEEEGCITIREANAKYEKDKH